MLRVTMLVDTAQDPQGVKEQLAMLLERFGDTRVVSVEELPMRQLGMEERRRAD